MRVLGTVLALGSLFATSVAAACSCAPPPPPRDALKASTAVFSGKVTDIEKIGDFQIAATIEVASAWKGVKGKSVRVVTANQSAACGFNFEKGKQYLVYASEMKQGDGKVLSTNLCTRTAALKDAKKDLEELGEAPKAK